MRQGIVSILSCVAISSVASSVVTGQQQAPAQPDPQLTFRTEVNYVEIDAQVTNEQGEPIEDLTADDFELDEEGRRQQIKVFIPVRIPIERAVARGPVALESDVSGNSDRSLGRLYVIVLDDLHTYVPRTNRVKLAARRFIEEYLGPNDLAALVCTSGRSDASQDLTSSKRRLLEAVDRFQGRKLRSSTLERLDEYGRQRDALATENPDSRRSINDPLDPQRAQYARSAMQTVAHVADWLNKVQGRRKALLFISEGIDYDIHNLFDSPYASAVLDDALAAIGAATRANVNIYSIDPRGLAGLGDEAMEIGGLPSETSVNLGLNSLQTELRLAQDSLRVLSDQTGGVAALNSNDFGPAFTRIVAENSSYYVLGYQPTDDRRNGRFRKVEVRVKRPGARVRARRGYVAPKGKVPETKLSTSAGTSAQLIELLNQPVPVAGMGLETTAAPFKGSGNKASVLVAVQLDGRRFTFTERDGLFQDTLEMSLIAVDRLGKVAGGDRSSIELKLKPETHQAVSQAGFRMLSRFEVAPGRYQLRVAARDTGSAAGSVHYDLDVPDFSTEGLMMSGLVLTAVSAQRIPTARADPVLGDVLPASPITDRVFGTNDALAIFAEVYDNRKAAADGTLELEASLTAEDGTVAFRSSDQRSPSAADPRRAHAFEVRVPLAELAPGTYVVKMEAKGRGASGEPVSRAVPIRIVAAGRS